MKLLFRVMTGQDYDFKERCKLVIGIGILLALLAAGGLIYGLLLDETAFTAETFDQVRGFYVGSGSGLLAASLAVIGKQIWYLKDQELRKRTEIYFKDERNRAVGLRSWAWAGYSLLLTLYVALLFFASRPQVIAVLLSVMSVFALYLLVFNRLFKRLM